jgi:sucrose phosphorylase
MTATMSDPFLEEPLFPSPQLRLHLPEPDFSRALLEMTPEQKESLLEKLRFLYGEAKAQHCFLELERVMRVYYAHKTPEMIKADRDFDPRKRFSERDAILITYGDLIDSPGKSPLRALADLLNIFVRRTINTVHLLPFFPYSSDRGFSVMDYEQVDPRLGSWEDVEKLSLHFRLLFDGVVNHVSSKSRWFQQFVSGNRFYEDFFIQFSTEQPTDDDRLRLILRPRTSDLLTPVHTINGIRYVWTTFSPDQIDLNYKNETVLVRIVETLLNYVQRGANIIRLDAVTYLWCELGTSCAHLQQTHTIVQLFRSVLDVVAPKATLLTETNVPHQDNISYFGDGTNEAQMVYNFALPPLVLHTMQTGDCRRLCEWAAGLENPSDYVTYLNFLASHDGIGVLPVRNILTTQEMESMIQKVETHGGLVSYRTSREGTVSPYELNITWFSALNREDSGESLDLQVDRYMASRSIAFVLQGVPAVYLPSLFGNTNDYEAIKQGGEPRSINRRTGTERELWEQLGDSDSRAYKVCSRFVDMLEKRVASPAFHPNARQVVLHEHPHVFTVLREAVDGSQLIVTLTNVSSENQHVQLTPDKLGVKAAAWRDILAEETLPADNGGIDVTLGPYHARWLALQRD